MRSFLLPDVKIIEKYVLAKWKKMQRNLIE